MEGSAGGKDEQEFRFMSRRERVVCSTLCMCLALSVMSAVALVYLTVIIYLPSRRELSSGFGETSVMCTTRETRRIKGDIDACRWSSCTEWCLSRGGGDCTHLYVSVRSNGTDMDLQECTDVENKECPTLDLDLVVKRNCKEDHQCDQLDQMFRCEKGVCWNITDVYACTYTIGVDTDPPLSCDKKRNCVELEGMYDCRHGRCRRINRWTCERRCTDIKTRDKNVIVQSGDNIAAANCRRAVESSTGEIIWDATLHPGEVLLASCTTLTHSGDGKLSGYDCINGTVLPAGLLGEEVTNYTVLNAALDHHGYKHRLDPTLALLPFESDITIFNLSRLMINHEGCVNTLSGECLAFYKSFGRDGRNQTSPARFPCFYAPRNPDFVVKRFDVAETKRLFLLFFVVPASLLVFSWGVVFLCSKALNIDDTGHMRFNCCSKKESYLEVKSAVATQFANDDTDDF